jgi:hypothetical protein
MLSSCGTTTGSDFERLVVRWGDLLINGFIKEQQLISTSFSGCGIGREFTIAPTIQTFSPPAQTRPAWFYG